MKANERCHAKSPNARVADTAGDVVMRDLLAFIVVGMMLVAVAAPAAAQEGGGGGGGDATTYDFEDDLVQGDLVRPDGENLMVRRRGARESLIKIREHFINELLKSVENL
jgi:hypothetical protein